MYRETQEEMMTFDNMKQLIGIAMFSLMMCIMAMFTLNGCCRNENNGVDSIDTVLVDSVDSMDSVDTMGYDSIEPMIYRPNVDSCMVSWNKRK